MISLTSNRVSEVPLKYILSGTKGSLRVVDPFSKWPIPIKILKYVYKIKLFLHSREVIVRFKLVLI